MQKLKYLYRAYRYRYRKDPVEINYILGNLPADHKSNHKWEGLKKGDVAIDIGCHKGAYLYWIQKQVGPEGYCYGFEPQPMLFNYLKGLSSNFDFRNTLLEQLAFSDHIGELSLNVPPNKKGSSPGATLNEVQSGNGWIQHKVKVTTLDAYFLPLSGSPDFIKIDVEGHEYELLKGGSQLLQTVQPTLLLECENRHLNNRTVEDVFALLESYGYKGFFIHRKSILPLEQFDANRHQINKEGRFWEDVDYVNNFIFEPG